MSPKTQQDEAVERGLVILLSEIERDLVSVLRAYHTTKLLQDAFRAFIYGCEDEAWMYLFLATDFHME